jgi:hypothetical protein
MENPFKLQLRQRGKEIKSAFSTGGGGFLCAGNSTFLLCARKLRQRALSQSPLCKCISFYLRARREYEIVSRFNTSKK